MKVYKKITLGAVLIAPIALIISCEEKTVEEISKNLQPHWIEGKNKEFVDLNKTLDYSFKQKIRFKSSDDYYDDDDIIYYNSFYFDANDNFEWLYYNLKYSNGHYDNNLKLDKKVYEKYRKVNYYEVSFTGILKGEERVRKPYKFKLLDMFGYYKFGFNKKYISGGIYKYSFNIQKTQNDLITIYEIREDDYNKKIEFKE